MVSVNFGFNREFVTDRKDQNFFLLLLAVGDIEAVIERSIFIEVMVVADA